MFWALAYFAALAAARVGHANTQCYVKDEDGEVTFVWRNEPYPSPAPAGTPLSALYCLDSGVAVWQAGDLVFAPLTGEEQSVVPLRPQLMMALGDVLYVIADSRLLAVRPEESPEELQTGLEGATQLYASGVGAVTVRLGDIDVVIENGERSQVVELGDEEALTTPQYACNRQRCFELSGAPASWRGSSEGFVSVESLPSIDLPEDLWDAPLAGENPPVSFRGKTLYAITGENC